MDKDDYWQRRKRRPLPDAITLVGGGIFASPQPKNDGLESADDIVKRIKAMKPATTPGAPHA